MKILKRVLVVFVIFFMSVISCNAFEIMLPKEKNSTVYTNNALIIGKAQNSETITINGSRIPTAHNGAFTYSVKLKNGCNRVVIKSDYSIQIYKINKKIQVSSNIDELEEFIVHPMFVRDDNTPLRSTPIDAALNRLSHLFRGTTVLVDASKGNFYRVRLSKNDVAWIAKKDVREYGVFDKKEVASFINMSSQMYKNATQQSISFTKNLPYTIEERDEEILFRIYNPEYSEDTVYTLNIPKPKKYLYHVNLVDGTYTFKVCELTNDPQNLTIIVDAGHGGSEKGALGCIGTYEKDVNLVIALELQKKLKDKGINVVMTRECDGNMSLKDRVSIAKESEADILVSIHLNSIPDIPFNIHKHRGTSVYYFNKNSKDLADILQKTVTKHADTKKDGVHAASLAVVRPTDYVGVLVECAYMINPYDSILYTSQEFASNVADGILEGILNFVTEN